MTKTEGYIESIETFPLTGARGNPQEEAVLGRGGFAGDHEFVLYDPAGNARVSQKQCRVLAQVAVSVDQEGNLTAERDLSVAPDAKPWRLVVPVLARASLVEVIEFGDSVPCYDMGQGAADEFSELLGRPVRLARKTDEWLRGGVIAPAARATATVHVGLAETVEALGEGYQSKTGKTPQFGPERLRAQLVVRGFPPFADAEWVGGTLLVGDEGLLEVDRLTQRCPVPGTDQETGVDMKDLPVVYPLTVKADTGKPTIGAYAHSVTDEPVTVRVGDSVRWVKA